MSRCILVVASTHRGKSTWIKKRIKGKKAYILDVKNEYPKGCKKWQDLSDREGFLKYIIDSEMKGTCVVMEEASFYLSKRHYSKQAERVILNKWESKNIFFVVFHSIKKINTMLFDYADYMVLFHTKDQLKDIKDYDPLIVKGFQEVQRKCKIDKHFHKIITLDDI